MDLDNVDQDWKREAPMLAAMDIKNPFTVPENYFDALKDHLNARVLAESLGFEHEKEFDIPQGYFEQLPEQIETGIKFENLKELVPVDGFTVPSGYFDNLEYRISSRKDKQNGSNKTLVHSLPNWVNYAAACITLIIGTAVFFNLQRNNLEVQMAKIPEQEIVNYLQLNTDVGDTHTIIENLEPNTNFPEIEEELSTEELEQYINTTL